jgi:hypothetical protein
MILFNKSAQELPKSALFLFTVLMAGAFLMTAPAFAATPSLGGGCVAEPSQAVVGEEVTWNADIFGGRGAAYTNFYWSGSESLEGKKTSIRKIYQTPGVKTATVRIRSGNQQILRSCSVTVSPGSNFSGFTNVSNTNTSQTFFGNSVQAAQDQGGLAVACLASPDPAVVGQQITWTAFASGGNGQYSYSWNGTDNLSGNIPSITKAYSLSGFKIAEVTVISGQTSAKASCSVEVNEGRVAGAAINRTDSEGGGGAGSALLYTMLMLELILLAAVIFALFWLFSL